jgi:hypothetical protein
MTKPRKWIIYNGDTDKPLISGPLIAYAENLRVIEEWALDQVKDENETLKKENTNLREALWEASLIIYRCDEDFPYCSPSSFVYSEECFSRILKSLNMTHDEWGKEYTRRKNEEAE